MKAKYIIPLFALLLLTACGRKDETAALSGQTFYMPENVAFTSGLQQVTGGCAVGDTVYLIGRVDNKGSGHLIQRLPPAGGEAETLPAYQSALPSGGFTIFSTLQAGTDGTLWVMERLMRQSASEDGRGFQQEEVHILRNLDADGKELSRFEYAGLEEKLGMGYVSTLAADGEGDIFACAEKGVALLDETGEPRFTVNAEGGWPNGGLIPLGDGRMGTVRAVMGAPGEYAWTLHVIDKETKGLGAAFQLAAGTSNGITLYAGDANALFYYRMGDTLRIWREEAVEAEQLANLLDAGIEAYNLNLISLLNDGRLVIQSGNGYGEDDPPMLDILKPADAAQLQDRKALTLASLQLAGTIREAVMEFNRTSPDYHIFVTDYSQYGDREAALTRLVTEIGAGKMPDILDLYAVPEARWGANGLLEDLWPYIDKDPEISRETLMERVFQAAETDGKLYSIGRHFQISTLTGAKKAVGDRMAWTMADMYQALEAMPEGCAPVVLSRSNMLERLMGLDWSRFVSWGAGTCDFTGEEFKALLRSCKSLPAEPARSGGGTEAACLNREIMLYSAAIDSFTFPQRAKYLLGGDISYVGYPNEWGEVGSSFSFVSPLAMSSACRDKEGAWTFLRTLLLPKENTLYTMYFPVNKSDFEKQAERLMMPEYVMSKDGEYALDGRDEKIEQPVAMESYGGVDITYYAVTREDYDQLMELYHAIDTYSRWDPGLAPIITETAGAYFAGDKTLDEAAELIQNRASLYVSEQT